MQIVAPPRVSSGFPRAVRSGARPPARPASAPAFARRAHRREDRPHHDGVKAVVVTPRVKGSARLVERATPLPGPGEVRVSVSRVGIDGTDLELDRGLYGEPPAGEAELVVGHESFGVVESLGPGAVGLSPGDPVVPMVRRPDDCRACRGGEPDMCLKGEYTERGIKGSHGFLAEYYVESPRYLLPVPRELADVAVLLEPLAVVEKGLRHAWALQKRTGAWWPRRALVLGAGPLGLLAAVLLRLRGLDTFVYARHRDPVLARRLEEIGATYVAKHEPAGPIHVPDLARRFGPFDFLLEATGAPEVAMAAMRVIGPGGVLCLASVTGGEERLEICAACLELELVLGNRVVFGTVNANRTDFEAGMGDLARAAVRWPGWLAGLVTRRVPLERFREAFERRPGDVKVVVEV